MKPPLPSPRILLILSIYWAFSVSANPEPPGFILPDEVFDQFLQQQKVHFSTNLELGGHLDISSHGTFQYRALQPACFDSWLTLESLSQVQHQEPSSLPLHIDTLYIGCWRHYTVKLARKGPTTEAMEPQRLMSFQWPALSQSQYTLMESDYLLIEFQQTTSEESWLFKLHSHSNPATGGVQVRVTLEKKKVTWGFLYTLTALTDVSNIKKTYRMESVPDTVDPRLYTHKFYGDEGRISRENFLFIMNQILREDSSLYLSLPIQ